jgi:integrase/recombinase XerD
MSTSDPTKVYSLSLVQTNKPMATLTIPVLNDRDDTHSYHLEVTLPAPAQYDEKLLRMWLDEKSHKTIVAYLRDMTRFYQFLEQQIARQVADGEPYRIPSLASVTLEDVQAFKNSLTDLSPKSRTRAIASLKSALAYGARTGLLRVNVGAAVRLRRPEKKLAERIVSEQKVHAIIETVKDSPRNYALLNLLYYGGLRASEVCNLKWRNLQENQDSGQVTIFGKRNKTRSVLLDKETWDILQQLRRELATSESVGDDGYIFSSRQAASSRKQQGREKEHEHRLAESSVHRIVKDAALAAGVAVFTNEAGQRDSHFSPHWFRHAHATHAQQRGASASVIQATLGHESIETTVQYWHVMPGTSSATFLRN